MIKSNRTSAAICFLFLLSVFVAGAQQPSQYTQYLFHMLAVNPAYAGSQEALQVTALARRQWAAVDGAPVTVTGSAHTPIRNSKMGLGLLFVNDRISIFNQNTLSGIYAYNITLSPTRRLSFGIQAGIRNLYASYEDLISKTPNDPALDAGDYRALLPAFGCGTYYYTDKFWLGLSVPYIASAALRTRSVADQLIHRNYYFLTTGHLFSLSPDITCKPSLLLKYINGLPVQADLNMQVFFRHLFCTGISYRSFNALNFMAQLHLSPQLRIGYAYDANLRHTRAFHSGAHEFMISYLFLFEKNQVPSPRYF